MNILSIDTSSNNCSVAVVSEKATLGELNINYNLQHSVVLMPLIEELLDRLQLSPKDLSAITVSKGPGSFTGLRIGLAAAKGMALALNIPVYAADALATLAYGVFGFQGILVPMVDALRGGFYTGFYTFHEGTLQTLMEPTILSMEEVQEKLAKEDREILLLGDVLDKLPEEVLRFKPQVVLAPQTYNIPKASLLPYLLQDRIEEKAHEDLHTLVPLYMRKSQAEVEYEKKKGKLL